MTPTHLSMSHEGKETFIKDPIVLRNMIAEAIADGFTGGNEHIAEMTEIMQERIYMAADAAIAVISSHVAAVEKERDNARNDEWLAAISAVQFMSANWWQDCRSEVERKALQAVTEDVISALRSVGPTEYLDVQWKGAEAAMAAEEKAERLRSELSTARRTALLEAAEIAETVAVSFAKAYCTCESVGAAKVMRALHAKAEAGQ